MRALMSTVSTPNADTDTFVVALPLFLWLPVFFLLL